MGIVKDSLSKAIEIYREEIMPLRSDLLKAGILKPEQSAYDPKASLVDPWSYANTAYGYKEKYSLLDFYKCRQITYSDPVVAAIIQTRLNQAAAFATPQRDKYKMGFRVRLTDEEKEPSKQEMARAKEIEQFLMNCGVPENFEDTPELKRRDNFETFLRKIIRDSLTFDQVNFEIVPRSDGKPYMFQAVDAATIRVIPDKKENIEQFYGADSGAGDVPVVSTGTEKHFKEFKPKSPRYAQVIQGTVRHVFDEWELCHGVRNPRTDITSYGYGYSEIEMLVTTITSHMNAETYNRKFFSQGSSIKGVITFEGAVPPDQLEAFRRQWYQQVTGVNNAWRTPIMSLGKDNKMNFQSLHSTNREMEFGKWLEYCIKTMCGVFQIDPIEIGFDISKMGSGQSGGGGGGLGNGNQAERYEQSQDKGLRPLLVFIQGLLNDYIVRRIDPNYTLEFVGLNVNSEKDDLDRAVTQVKAFKTINEIRAEHDLEELDMEKIKKNPGEIILDSSFIQFISGQIQAAREQEQQAQGMGADGMPQEGAPPEGGGAPQGGAQGQEQQEPEPDYNSMSTEDLQKEYEKLQAQSKEAPPEEQKKKPKDVKKSFVKELEL
jgi:hypothetical protein